MRQGKVESRATHARSGADFAAVLPNKCPGWQRGSLSCDRKGRIALNRSLIVFRAAFLASSRACTSSSSVATSVSVEIVASNAVSCFRSDCRYFLCSCSRILNSIVSGHVTTTRLHLTTGSGLGRFFRYQRRQDICVPFSGPDSRKLCAPIGSEVAHGAARAVPRLGST